MADSETTPQMSALEVNDIMSNSRPANGMKNGTNGRRNSTQGLPYVPLINRMQKRITSGDLPFFSFEFFTPKTKEAAMNLIGRFDRLRQSGPMFCDITWHSAGNPGSDTETSSITIAGVALNYSGLETMLHITCVGMSESDLRRHLERAKELGIRNILALRGDRFDNVNDEHAEFKYAIDLVKFIRKEYEDYFIIAVAGYPKAHPESESTEKDLEYLKAKVDAGATRAITQFFFDNDIYMRYLDKVRARGINIPIVPGIVPVQNFKQTANFAKRTGASMPAWLADRFEGLDDDPQTRRLVAATVAAEQVLDLVDRGVYNFHFYTMNRADLVYAICHLLGMRSVFQQQKAA